MNRKTTPQPQTMTEKSPFERMKDGYWTYLSAVERVRTNPIAVNCNAEFALRRERDALARQVRGSFRVA